MDLQTFSPFPRLPFDIRTEIWLCAIVPATVYTRPAGRKYQERPRKQENPILLWVCHESRTIALKRYESVPDIDKTYVNFDLDTVYIDFDGSFTIYDDPFCSSENEARFQYLAVDTDWVDVFGEALVEKVSRCQSLRQLTLVVGFTKAINREYEANLSTYLVKYKDMTEDEIADTLGDEDSFRALCEAIAAAWQLIALKKLPNKDKWPEVFITTRPAITRTRRGFEGNVDFSNQGLFLMSGRTPPWIKSRLGKDSADLYALEGWKCKGQAARASFEEKS